MRYRTLLLEFLAQYREYQFDYFQVVLFNYVNRDSILTVIDEKEKVALYQVAGASVFQKMVSFKALEKTVVELILATNTKIETEVKNLDQYIDCFSSQPVIKRKSRYLLSYPIIVNDEIIGCFIIYSPYLVSWQLENSKVQNLINNLTIAKCQELEREAIDLVGSNVFSFTKASKTFLSDALAKHTKLSCIVQSFKSSGYQLARLKEVSWLDGTLTGYDIIKTQPVFSIKAINEPLYKDYQLIFLKGEHCSLEAVNKIIKQSDGAIGRYQIYDCGDEAYLISTKEAFKKSLIDELFSKMTHIVVRYGHELNRSIDLKALVGYLKGAEVFDKNAFDAFEKELLATATHQIHDQYQPNKIKIRVIASSMEVHKVGYLIEDTTDLARLGLNGKKKSLQALLKTVDEYKNDFLYLKLSDDALFIDQKLNNALLKIVTELIHQNESLILLVREKLASLITEKDEALSKRIILILGDDAFKALPLASKLGGLFIDHLKMATLSTNTNTMNATLKFLVSITPIVLIEIDPNEITKYHLEHLMLVGF